MKICDRATGIYSQSCQSACKSEILWLFWWWYKRMQWDQKSKPFKLTYWLPKILFSQKSYFIEKNSFTAGSNIDFTESTILTICMSFQRWISKIYFLHITCSATAFINPQCVNVTFVSKLSWNVGLHIPSFEFHLQQAWISISPWCLVPSQLWCDKCEFPKKLSFMYKSLHDHMNNAFK